jgi:hypothetical protein
MKIKSIDRNTARQISADINTAVQSVATKYGISLKDKGCRFSSTNATFKIEAALIGAGGVVVSSERNDYTRYCFMYNLNPSWLDKSFNHGSDVFTIIGLATRKRKNPVLTKSAKNGKTYIFPANTVKALMEATSK